MAAPGRSERDDDILLRILATAFCQYGSTLDVIHETHQSDLIERVNVQDLVGRGRGRLDVRLDAGFCGDAAIQSAILPTPRNEDNVTKDWGQVLAYDLI